MRLAPASLVIPDGVQLLFMHDDADPIEGASLSFTDDGDALTFSALLPDNRTGRRALDAVREGRLAGASLGLRFDCFDDPQECDGSVVATVSRAHVDELSLVDRPALRSSLIEIADGDAVARDQRLASCRGLQWAASRLNARW